MVKFASGQYSRLSFTVSLSVLCRTKDEAEMKLGREKRLTLSPSRDDELASLIGQQQNLHFKQRDSKLEQATENSLQ